MILFSIVLGECCNLNFLGEKMLSIGEGFKIIKIRSNLCLLVV